MILTGMLIGLGVGILATALAARLLLRRHLERELSAERRARAAERMAEIGSMTGGLAHEIKNPLSTIGLNAQLLAESIEDLSIPDDERSRLLSRIRSLRREVERLRGILTDFLEFAGQVHLEPHVVDVNTMIGELVDFYMPEAERQGIRLLADVDPHPLPVRLDPKHVKQAILNLMLNATQAMAGQGGGTGDAGRTGPGELILRTRRTRDPDGRATVSIHVIDTGPGMDAERLTRIFTPYFTTRSGGTGLGLPTSRRLVEGHGGRIEVHSEPGTGTDFTVVLPVDGPNDAGPI